MKIQNQQMHWGVHLKPTCLLPRLFHLLFYLFPEYQHQQRPFCIFLDYNTLVYTFIK